jgi:hypothetical protein
MGMTKTTARIVVAGWILSLLALAIVIGGELIESLWTHPGTFVTFWIVAGSYLAYLIWKRKRAAS